MVLYGDLTKEEVLCALYNNAKAQGMGIFMFVPGDLTIEQARKLLNQRTLKFLKAIILHQLNIQK